MVGPFRMSSLAAGAACATRAIPIPVRDDNQKDITVENLGIQRDERCALLVCFFNRLTSVPATRALPQARPGVDLRSAGRVDQSQRRNPCVGTPQRGCRPPHRSSGRDPGDHAPDRDGVGPKITRSRNEGLYRRASRPVYSPASSRLPATWKIEPSPTRQQI